MKMKLLLNLDLNFSHLILFNQIAHVLYIKKQMRGPSWSWSYSSWIYNYLCNQCLSELTLWVRIALMVRCITLCDRVCQWLAAGRWFSPGIPIFSSNKTDLHDIAEILLKVALSSINLTLITNRFYFSFFFVDTPYLNMWKPVWYSTYINLLYFFQQITSDTSQQLICITTSIHIICYESITISLQWNRQWHNKIEIPSMYIPHVNYDYII